MKGTLYSLLRNWGLALMTPLPLLRAPHLPRFAADWRRYAKLAREQGRPAPALADAYPCLGDHVRETPFDAHYFHQGAWLARRIAAARPAQHVDIGSSVLTMGVLCAQVPTVFVDYRPLRARIPGLACVAGDSNHLPFADGSIASLSCLHVIEHVGLGRYGDALDPGGSARTAAELARVLGPGGRLLLSTPVGRERTCFNAHRVFAPRSLVALFGTLRLESFSLVDDAGALHEGVSPESADSLDYGCGLFEFVKQAAHPAGSA
jgi:SAM-dependent methyltransferase